MRVAELIEQYRTLGLPEEALMALLFPDMIPRPNPAPNAFAVLSRANATNNPKKG